MAASACSTTNPDAATVNGTHINRRGFEADMNALASNDAYMKAAAAAQASGGPTVQGDAPGTISTEFAASQLGNVVALELIHAEATTRKLIPDAEMITQAETVAKGLLGLPNPQADGGAAADAVWAALPASMKKKYTGLAADFLALQKDLTPKNDTELRAIFDVYSKDIPEQMCSSHILVATEADAAAALDDLKQGKTFADVAKARSTDPGSKDTGGSLRSQDGTCPDPSGFVKEFVDGARAATIGVPTAPVKTEFGYHIILVEKPIGKPSFEDFKPQLEPTAPRLAFQMFLQKSRSGAKASIDPHYGTWDPTSGVVPTKVAGTASPGAPTTAVLAPSSIP